jgi:AraC-like DNA-binding protein
MSAENAYQLFKFHSVHPTADAWKQFESLFALTPLRMADNVGEIESFSWIAGTCVFAQVAMDGNAHEHTEKHIERSGDLLFVHRFLTGGSDGRSADVPFTLRPGMIIFHDYSRPYEGIQPPSTLQSVHIPHDLVGYDSKTMPPHIILDVQSPHGASINAAFDAMMPDFLAGRDELEKVRLEHLMDLVRAALPRPNEDASIAMQVQAFIEKRLGDQTLTIEDVQDAFQLSRAQVFEILGLFGGFDAYLASRRTFCALFDLYKHRSTEHRLEDVSAQYGFGSVDAFNQAVSMRYGTDLHTIFAA